MSDDENIDNKDLKEAPDEVALNHEDVFEEKLNPLIEDAEAMRMSFMRHHQTREHITMTVGLISIIAGASGFGWFLMMDVSILRAIASMAIAILVPMLLNIWAQSILKEYKRSYKRIFLPKLAKAIGGFKFHPARGIGRKVIAKTGVIPRHDLYEAEDCFMGQFKGVKVLFSEARLKHKKQYMEPIFDGIFVLLEIPEPMIEGHTIMTADDKMYNTWKGSRWKSLQRVDIKAEQEEWNIFKVVSDEPEAAKSFITQRLIKELYETSKVFDDSPLSVVFFKKKFIFMMIPYSADMFEASSIHLPIATKRHAMQCRKEIEQILEIVDVFEIYKKEDA